MAKYSMKQGGKEVGPASVYAKPHNNPVMAGRPVPSGEKTAVTKVNGPQPSTFKAANINYQSDPNQMSALESTPGGMPARRVSGGNPARDDVKTTGIKIRGTGCATKGLMARGPMA